MNLASLHSLIILSGCFVSAHVIRTKVGRLEGVTQEARNKKLFHAYYGIPYAKAPVGKLRFEPPVEAGAWNGIFNATVLPSPCPQRNENQDGIYEGQEDCLFLNIYTPKNPVLLPTVILASEFPINGQITAARIRNSTSIFSAELNVILAHKVKAGSNVPVLFYIFGGKFKYGNPIENGPEYLMSRDVVIVMVSYRLGVLGLLSTGDTVIPGNMALKDQSLAMKWTKENIYEFGGNPDRITLHGHSSGAVNAHLHTLSPLSEKYFHQIILQSGLGIAPQSFKDRDTSRGIARALATRLNCPTYSSGILKQCLQGKTAEELVTASEQLFIWYGEPTAIFTPVIEDQSVENAFLSENPLDASYISDKKPMLIGITSSEAALHITKYFHPDSDVLNMNPKLLFPIISFFGWTSKPSHVDFIAQMLRAHFFNEEDINEAADTDFVLVEMLTGIMQGYEIMKVLQKYKGLTYAYLFDYIYTAGYTTAKDGGRGGRYLGVAHGDEIPIIFLRPKEKGITKEDFAFGDEMITRWINFVYSGNPNVPFPINVDVIGAWSPVSSKHMEFLRMKNGGNMEKDYFLERFGFWRKIPLFSKYR